MTTTQVILSLILSCIKAYTIHFFVQKYYCWLWLLINLFPEETKLAVMLCLDVPPNNFSTQ